MPLPAERLPGTLIAYDPREADPIPRQVVEATDPAARNGSRVGFFPGQRAGRPGDRLGERKKLLIAYRREIGRERRARTRALAAWPRLANGALAFGALPR